MKMEKALRLALEALEYSATQIKPDYEHSKAITAIKAALEAKDEPVAWYLQSLNQRGVSLKKETQEWKPLYTTPPKRTWISLTDDEIEMIVENRRAAHWEFVRQVEAKLKEKNT
jgi:hypothetical protein